MGTTSIQINKAKGLSDTGASDHIEQRSVPKNVAHTYTYGCVDSDGRTQKGFKL